VNSGVALKARSASGKLRFYAGGDSPTYERMTILSNGNVGVGNNAPDYPLDVDGTINASAYLLNGSPINITSPWSTNSNNTYYNEGFVGIGTENPERSLEINIDADGTNAPRGAILIKNLDNSGKSSIGTIFYSGTGSNEAGGALGITAMSYDAVPDFAGYTYLQNENGGVALKARNSDGKLRFYTGGDDPTYERMTILSNGNVGVGNNAPDYPLDINGAINASEYLLNGSAINITTPWSTNSNNTYYNEGFVGIGTENPDRSLDINIDSDGTISQRSGLIMKNLNNSSSSIMDAVIKSGTGSNEAGGGIGTSALSYSSVSDFAGYTYVYNVNSGVALKARSASGKLRFYTGGDDPINERMTISSTGNVGVDNADPKSKLQISEGDVYIDQIGSGVIMKSPDGNCWRMTVDNSGNPIFSTISCPN
jgi:hypothetical protein